jgi:hypothetical protein
MLDKIIDIIPEFYFDLIARIFPGALICIALAFPIFQLETLVSKIKDIPAPLIFLFFVASYITGFLLDAVTALFEEFFDYKYTLYTSIKSGKKSEYHTIYEDIGGIAEYANPSSILSLKKVAAELTLLRVLIAGWIIIGVLNKFSLHQYWLIFVIVLISLVLSYVKWFRCIKKSIVYLSRAKPKKLVA